jgi:hypothetical protein
MHRPPPHIDPQLAETIKTGYETRDISLPAITKWLIGLFIGMSFSAFLAFLLYALLAPVGTSGPTTNAVRNIPPSPVIQADPIREIKEYNAVQDAALNSYGKNPDTGALHMPVARALDLTAQRGLPADNGSEHPGGVPPTEASGGTVSTP